MRSKFDRTPLKNNLKEIEELYTQGYSTAKIAKQLNSSAESIRLLLHSLGVKVRSRKEACSKYRVNEQFFNKIDTEDKAYWLGFLTADGGVVGGQLILSLKMMDKEHINKFLDCIQSNHPIKTVVSHVNGKNIKQPRLVISSRAIINALQKHGVGERKSLTVRPTNIECELRSSYWRGLFDGDGHINVTDKRRVCELTGNKYMLAGFSKYLKEMTGIASKIKKHKSVYRIRHSKRSCVFSIANLLYSCSNIHLNRKHQMAKTVFSDQLFLLRKNSILRTLSGSAKNATLSP